MNREIYEKITKKKELSQLPKKDVEKAFGFFEKRQVSDEEKIRLTRDLLNKIYWPFRSHKLLGLKDKSAEWILRKHMSSRERLPDYKKIYSKVFKKVRESSVIDLGAGINGVSYEYFPCDVNYVGVEAVGQLADLANYFFKNNKIKAKVFHESLFELEKIKKLIKKTKKPCVVFLFKVLDSLEMLERNYSKELLLGIVPLVERVVVSFATRSIIKKERFKVTRKWVLSFIEENFNIIDDFEIGSERYVVFGK